MSSDLATVRVLMVFNRQRSRFPFALMSGFWWLWAPLFAWAYLVAQPVGAVHPRSGFLHKISSACRAAWSPTSEFLCEKNRLFRVVETRPRGLEKFCEKKE